MGKVQSQLRDDEILLSPRGRHKSFTPSQTAGVAQSLSLQGVDASLKGTGATGATGFTLALPLEDAGPVSPRRPRSLSAGHHNHIVKLLVSPRRSNPPPETIFCGEVKQIDPYDLQLFENIGWGATGKCRYV